MAQIDTGGEKTAGGGGEAAGGVERRGERDVVSVGGGVERVLEEVRREFSGLPVYVGVEGGYSTALTSASAEPT